MLGTCIVALVSFSTVCLCLYADYRVGLAIILRAQGERWKYLMIYLRRRHPRIYIHAHCSTYALKKCMRQRSFFNTKNSTNGKTKKKRREALSTLSLTFVFRTVVYNKHTVNTRPSPSFPCRSLPASSAENIRHSSFTRPTTPPPHTRCSPLDPPPSIDPHSEEALPSHFSHAYPTLPQVMRIVCTPSSIRSLASL